MPSFLFQLMELKECLQTQYIGMCAEIEKIIEENNLKMLGIPLPSYGYSCRDDDPGYDAAATPAPAARAAPTPVAAPPTASLPAAASVPATAAAPVPGAAASGGRGDKYAVKTNACSAHTACMAVRSGRGKTGFPRGKKK